MLFYSKRRSTLSGMLWWKSWDFYQSKLLQSSVLALATTIPISVWAVPKLELINQINVADTVAVTVQGNYAYTGDGTTLKILNVSDPKNPTVVGTSAPLHTDLIHEIVVKDNYAYVANSRGGLRILDISNPQNPVQVGVYNSNQPNNSNGWALWGIDIRDNYAYVADMESGLRVVDISNPAKPVEVGFYDTPGLAHTVKLNGNFAYVVDWNAGLRIVDITNSNSPKEVSFVATRGLTYGVDFSNDGKLAYIADYDGLRIVDISNPQSPQDISFFDVDGIAVHVVASGNYVYMNSYSDLKIIDVSNPTSPKEIDSYSAPLNNSGYGLSTNFTLNNNLLYVPNREKGLLVLSNGEEVSSVCGGVTEGLVACYPFDGNANDESGNNLNGFVDGATLTSDRFGNTNNAYFFNGSNAIQVTTPWNKPHTGEITHSFWFNPSTNLNSSSGRQNLLGAPTIQSYYVGSSQGWYGGSGLVFEIWGNFFPPKFYSVQIDFAQNTWHHVVIEAKEFEFARIIIDGVTYNLDVPNFTFADPESTTGIKILIGSEWEQLYFNGKIDDVLIYNRALTEDEIKQLYDGVGNTSCESSQATLQNLIINSDFSEGNTKFDSDYLYYPNNGQYTISNPASYWVGDDPIKWNWAVASLSDHSTGNGLMLIADGALQPNKSVWQQKVAVTPNTSYLFSGWAASWGSNNGTDPSPPILRVLINGIQMDQDIVVPAKTGEWSKFEVNWNSENSTEAIIEIIDTNLVHGGNDFSLDDLSMLTNSCSKPIACTEWNLAKDFRMSPDQENPNRDSCGNKDVWHFIQSGDMNRNPQTYTLMPNFSTNSRYDGTPGVHNWTGTEMPDVTVYKTEKDSIQSNSSTLSKYVHAHPGWNHLTVVGWRSPISGNVKVNGEIASIYTKDGGGCGSLTGDGIKWYIDKDNTNLAAGAFPNQGSQNLQEGTIGNALSNIPVMQGEFIYLAIDRNANAFCDATKLDITISQVGTTEPATCPESPTIHSKGIGNWSDINTWDQGRVPNTSDIVQIESSHTITAKFSEIAGLCNFGTINSQNSDLRIEAANFIYNTGSIQASNAKNSECPTPNNPTQYRHPTQLASGNNVFLWTDKFANEGKILGGTGGDDSTWLCLSDNSPGKWSYPVISTDGTIRLHKSEKGTWGYQSGETQYGFPSVGGIGGKVEIHSTSFTNQGTIQGGKGGTGDSSTSSPGNDWGNGVHGVSIGGKGGEVIVTPANLEESSNHGTLAGGCGGDVDIPGCWSSGDIACNANNINPSRPGNGGDVTFNALEMSGIIKGCTGSRSSWDPTILKATATTRFEGSDHVEIYGRENWVMDLTDLTEGAITANKTITIAVGQGGTIDLRGVKGKVFQAAEKVEIFADNLLLDDGVTIQDLTQTANVTMATGKILYRVALSTEQQFVGQAGETLPIQLNVFNNGPTSDTYTLSVESSKGWQISQLPKTVTIDELKSVQLALDVTLSSATGDNGVITITATSQHDPQTSAKAIIRVSTEGLTEVIQGDYYAHGTLLDKQGNPIAGATITIDDQTTTTDELGNWEINGLVEGEYTLTAAKESYVFAPQVIALGNNAYHQKVTINPLSSLALSVIPDTWQAVRQGEDLTYTMTITNGGSVTATNVTLTNQLPTGATLLSLESVEAQCDTETLICTLPTLTSGATATVKLTLHNDLTDTLKTVSTLTSTEYPVDVKTSFKAVKPHLSVTLTDTPDPVVMESALHYQAAVELSPLALIDTATGISLTLQLPAGTEFKKVTTEYGTCDSSHYPVITCQLNDLSIATPDSISRAIVDVDVQLIDASLLILTHEVKVGAANYPEHLVRERTNIVVPENAVADIVLVVDTTESMGEELNGVIVGIEKFIQTQIANNTIMPTVALVEFKDNVTLRAFTNDMNALLATVRSLAVEGGGLCPEASAEALHLAISHTKQGGVILFSTDASPYEDADMAALAQRIKEKGIVLNAIISGDCTDGASHWNDVQSELSH